jgi:hypothetical protein
MATKSKKAEAKLVRTKPIVALTIPARYKYGVSPAYTASQPDALKDIAKLKTDHKLEGCVIGDYLAIQNAGCEETFILHKDVVKELAEAVA